MFIIQGTSMLHKIIKGSEAINVIENFINDEKERADKIVLLDLSEVNLYINTVNSI